LREVGSLHLTTLMLMMIRNRSSTSPADLMFCVSSTGRWKMSSESSQLL
jgi:hypothetical protein